MHHSYDAVARYGEYLSRSQVADLFNVSPSTITRWAEEGKLTHVRTLGGHRRYLTQDVLELVRTLSKERRMQTITTRIPRMYGDHHVIAVQNLLSGQSGVQEVQASAASRLLAVLFDPELTTAEVILTRLAAGGYPPGPDYPLAEEAHGHKDPAWAELGLRMTQTHPADR